MAEITLEIEGMHCGGCVRRVTQALTCTPGVDAVTSVSIGEAKFESALEPPPVEAVIEAVIEAVSKLGFPTRRKA